MNRLLEKYLPAILLAAFIIGIIVLDVWWQWYKFVDCQSVGHCTLYCIGELLSGK